MKSLNEIYPYINDRADREFDDMSLNVVQGCTTCLESNRS